MLVDEALSWLETAEMRSELKTAIEIRMMFRQEFLNALQSDGQLGVKSQSHLPCLPLLGDIKGSSRLSKRVEESFSLKIQRTLTSSVPPRPMVTVEFNDAISHLERLCNDATDAGQLLQIEGNEMALTAFWTFMSNEPLPSVYVRALVQSFLGRDDKVMGKYQQNEFLRNDLTTLVLPNSPLLDPSNANDELACTSEERYRIAKLVDAFVSRCSLPYLNVFRTACLNRCRVRRTLCHAIMEWDNLQVDAEELDADLRIFTREIAARYSESMPASYAYPLSSWIYHYKLLQFEQIILIGFELSIYAPDEFPGMYWYLSYLCATHLSQLERMSFFVGEGERARTPFGIPSEQSGLSKLNNNAKTETALKRLFRIFTRLKAMEAFARALHGLYVILSRHGLVPKPPRPYSSDRLRHELRMRPFLPLSVPEPVDLETFVHESSLSGVSDHEVLEEAIDRVGEARRSWEAVLRGKWCDTVERKGDVKQQQEEHDGRLPQVRRTVDREWTKDVKDTLRACIATSIALGVLRKKMNAAKGRQARLPFSGLEVHIPSAGKADRWHLFWIAPKVVEP